jgi:putative transposase
LPSTGIDQLAKIETLLKNAGDWRIFLDGAGKEDMNDIRKYERTDRLPGAEIFIEFLESAMDRPLIRRKPGSKGKVS